MSGEYFSVPILFLIFNRRESALRVLETIRKVRPSLLFVAADGPRDGNANDIETCKATREAVLEGIDWPCEVKTLLRDQNLGCGKAVSGAITWFFENVECGIILEDDVLASPSFFQFCKEMLERFRNTPQITSISGSNLIDPKFIGPFSYGFSDYTGIWGWASWRRAWARYDYDVRDWNNPQVRRKFSNRFTSGQFKFFERIFDSISQVNTWDYQWWFHQLNQNGLTIIPVENLTRNIGFNEEATHTFSVRDDLKNLKSHELLFPLNHPETVIVNYDRDLALSRKFYWYEPNPLIRLGCVFVTRFKRALKW